MVLDHAAGVSRGQSDKEIKDHAVEEYPKKVSSKSADQVVVKTTTTGTGPAVAECYTAVLGLTTSKPRCSKLPQDGSWRNRPDEKSCTKQRSANVTRRGR